jgi:hypothetical protein
VPALAADVRRDLQRVEIDSVMEFTVLISDSALARAFTAARAGATML